MERMPFNNKSMTVVGISAMYHDSAAAVVRDGVILAAAQEERFTRIKHDNSLPFNAIDFCLAKAGIKLYQADAVVYYDRPLLTLDRYINNLRALGKDSDYLVRHSFDAVIDRLRIDELLRKRYGRLGRDDRLLTLEHHLSHAASAFYPSPFDRAAVLTVDGVGEWATTAIGIGSGSSLRLLKEMDYPDSLGLLYSAFASFCGFKVNSGEYKFMGLAPYGEPVYYDTLLANVIDLRPDGSFRLDLDYFDFYRGPKMTGSKMDALFGGPPREPESRITRREMDIAASVQKLTAEILLRLARTARELAGAEDLVMAGGVALNCAANGKLRESGIFDRIWIQPAAGDAGGALGCALYAYYSLTGKDRVPCPDDSQRGSYLGPSFDNTEIESRLQKEQAVYKVFDNGDLLEKTAAALAAGKVVGWFRGAMEFGPRALGNRSILADPRRPEIQSRLNLKIKHRESFRPFAPSVLEEDAAEYFDMDCGSPYMLLTARVKPERCLPFDKAALLEQYSGDMLPLVNSARSDIPAVTHLDYSARVQTVSRERCGMYYDLLAEFKRQTGCGVLVNTSFNVRGEPIVCTPEDAYACFMSTDMDLLVIGNCMLLKDAQPVRESSCEGRPGYEPD